MTRPDAAGANQSWTVEPQSDNRCASRRGSSDDARLCGTPTKMLYPNVQTRIEKMHTGVCARVGKMSLRSLEIVAPETAEAEIIEMACAPFGFGRDMVNGEVVSGQARIRATVFAEIPRAAADALAQDGGNAAHRSSNASARRSKISSACVSKARSSFSSVRVNRSLASSSSVRCCLSGSRR